jgi:hypothetical protein
MDRRRRFLIRPFPAFRDNGDAIMWTRPEMWASTDVNGWTVIDWEGRFHFLVRTETLESSTRLPS